MTAPEISRPFFGTRFRLREDILRDSVTPVPVLFEAGYGHRGTCSYGNTGFTLLRGAGYNIHIHIYIPGINLCGTRLCGNGISHVSRVRGIIPNPAQNRGINPAGEKSRRNSLKIGDRFLYRCIRIFSRPPTHPFSFEGGTRPVDRDNKENKTPTTVTNVLLLFKRVPSESHAAVSSQAMSLADVRSPLGVASMMASISWSYGGLSKASTSSSTTVRTLLSLRRRRSKTSSHSRPGVAITIWDRVVGGWAGESVECRTRAKADVQKRSRIRSGIHTREETENKSTEIKQKNATSTYSEQPQET